MLRPNESVGGPTQKQMRDAIRRHERVIGQTAEQNQARPQGGCGAPGAPADEALDLKRS